MGPLRVNQNSIWANECTCHLLKMYDGVLGRFARFVYPNWMIHLSFEDQVNYVCKMLQLFSKHRIKLKATKCELFNHEVHYLGRIVSAEGSKIDSTNTIAESFEGHAMQPSDVGELPAIMGLLSSLQPVHSRFLPYCRATIRLAESHSSRQTFGTIHNKQETSHKEDKRDAITQAIWTEVHQNILEWLIVLLNHQSWRSRSSHCHLCYTQTLLTRT